jgi:hypothetical protein
MRAMFGKNGFVLVRRVVLASEPGDGRVEVLRGLIDDAARLTVSVREKSAGQRATTRNDENGRVAFSQVSGAPARDHAGRRTASKTFAT